MNRTFISIDWDYFVPEKVDWDFGHKETKAFLHFIWKTRFSAYDKMRTNGTEAGFWDNLKRSYKLPDVIDVSDSHLSAYENMSLHLSDTLILIDRHHDVYTLPSKVPIDCGNWVAAWLDANKNRHCYWVAPKDVESTYMMPRYKKRVTVVKEIPILDDVWVTGLHACRSGCWTPPWLDEAFNRFIDASGCIPEASQLDWCDPLRTRFNLKDYREGFAIEYSRRKMNLEFMHQYPHLKVIG